MLARLSQLSRHFTRPVSASAQGSLVSPVVTAWGMASSSAAQQHLRSKIHTAGCLIIGDEVLGGKTVDSNSAWFAKYCFSMGIGLKRVEVIADDEAEIIEAVTRMSKNYDFVVTSGGIGPTHDDITYQSIARAFSLPLKLHDTAFAKMKALSKPHRSQPDFSWDVPSAALTAKMRMVELPYDESIADEDQIKFPREDMWVPVAVVNGNVHILPGIPRLFEGLLEALKPSILARTADPEGQGTYRMLFSTPLAESEVAGYLTELAAKVDPKGIKVGSYPRWGKKTNVVTLVGIDREYMNSLEDEVAKGVHGRRVAVEGEDDSDAEEDVTKDKDA